MHPQTVGCKGKIGSIRGDWRQRKPELIWEWMDSRSPGKRGKQYSSLGKTTGIWATKEYGFLGISLWRFQPRQNFCFCHLALKWSLLHIFFKMQNLAGSLVLTAFLIAFQFPYLSRSSLSIVTVSPLNGCSRSLERNLVSLIVNNYFLNLLPKICAKRTITDELCSMWLRYPVMWLPWLLETKRDESKLRCAVSVWKTLGQQKNVKYLINNFYIDSMLKW